MRLRLIETGRTEDFHEDYAERLIEQGRATIAPEEELPMNPPEPVDPEPEEKKEKPKTRKKGE